MKKIYETTKVIYGNLKGYLIKKEENVIEKVSKLKNKYSYLIKPLIYLILIFLIAFYPIIRANFNYLDDLGRGISGYREWTNFSRFTSEYLSIFVHTSDYLTDISPLTQFIAIFLLSISGIIIIYLFNDNKKITFTQLLAVVPIGLSPYFLECISYKFDSPYMALSILASVFPFIFYKGKKVIYSIMLFIGTIIMCTTYQAASGIIPLIAIFYAFKLWNNKETKEAIHFLFITAISYAIGLIVFKTLIMIPVDYYASSNIASLKELVPKTYHNLKLYYSYVISDFRKSWLILIGIMIILFIINTVKRSKQNKMLSTIMSIIVIIISSIIVFGLYIILEKPIFYPRAMYGIGILITLIGINTINLKKQYISKLVIFVLIWNFLTFSFTYGNALNEQKRYIDFRAQQVVNAISELDIMQTDTTKSVRLVGNAGLSPTIDNLPKDYKNLISRLVCQSFGGGWTWHSRYLLYFKLKNINIDDATLPPDDLVTVKNTSYYEIQTNNKDYILVNIK